MPYQLWRSPEGSDIKSAELILLSRWRVSWTLATVFPIYQVADTSPGSLQKASDEREMLRLHAKFHPIFE
jgi:hypothetical protein